MTEHSILITGACGQLGQALYGKLVQEYPQSKIVASDIQPPNGFEHFEYIDITRIDQISQCLSKYNVNEVYHLAAILSAKAESKPMRSWDINMRGLLNILKASAEQHVSKVFYPSSIAVFGSHADREMTAQFEVQHPTTLYGISKSAGENWCQYYHKTYDLDVRSLRYPGVIGPDALPGGGTTDYAVHIYHEAIKSGHYDCYLKDDTTLPMIYMDDALQATVDLMQADADKLTVRTAYNIAGMSFSPAEVANSIKNILPDFTIRYIPDKRQPIADNWPRRIDDSIAQKDWGWKPKYNLEKMTEEMLTKLQARYNC